jgi:hypothetical protein
MEKELENRGIIELYVLFFTYALINNFFIHYILNTSLYSNINSSVISTAVVFFIFKFNKKVKIKR